MTEPKHNGFFGELPTPKGGAPTKYYCHDCQFTYTTYQRNPRHYGCPKCGKHDMRKARFSDGREVCLRYHHLDRMLLNPVDYTVLYLLSRNQAGMSMRDLAQNMTSDISDLYHRMRTLCMKDIVTYDNISKSGYRGKHHERVKVFRLNTQAVAVQKFLGAKSEDTTGTEGASSAAEQTTSPASEASAGAGHATTS